MSEHPQPLAPLVAAISAAMRAMAHEQAASRVPVAVLHALILLSLARILDRLERMILDWQQGLLLGLPARACAARDRPRPGQKAGPERVVNAYLFRYEIILLGWFPPCRQSSYPSSHGAPDASATAFTLASRFGPTGIPSCRRRAALARSGSPSTITALLGSAGFVARRESQNAVTSARNSAGSRSSPVSIAMKKCPISIVPGFFVCVGSVGNVAPDSPAARMFTIAASP